MTFTSQLIVERSELGSRASVKEQGERTASAQATPPLLALGRRPGGRAGSGPKALPVLWG